MTFQELIVALNEATTAVGLRIQGYVDALATAGISKAAEDEAIAGLQVEIERLKAMGTNPSDPIPPVV